FSVFCLAFCCGANAAAAWLCAGRARPRANRAITMAAQTATEIFLGELGMDGPFGRTNFGTRSNEPGEGPGSARAEEQGFSQRSRDGARRFAAWSHVEL